MDIVFMRRDQPICWALMPQAMTRLMNFLDAYDTDTPKAELAEQVSRMFSAGDLRLGLWVMVDGTKVVGHLLAQPEPVNEPHGPWPYVLIRQAEVDPQLNSMKETERAMQEVEGWTQALRIQKIYMLTHREEKAMARRWGFQPFKHIMVKHLSKKSLGIQADNGISGVEPPPSGDKGS